MNHTNYLRVAIGAVAVIAVLGLFGVPVNGYLPFALILLVCPLMMFFHDAEHGPRPCWPPGTRRPPGTPRRPGAGRQAGRPIAIVP